MFYNTDWLRVNWAIGFFRTGFCARHECIVKIWTELRASERACLPARRPALPCPALPRPASPCPALPCSALPCPALPGGLVALELNLEWPWGESAFPPVAAPFPPSSMLVGNASGGRCLTPTSKHQAMLKIRPCVKTELRWRPTCPRALHSALLFPRNARAGVHVIGDVARQTPCAIPRVPAAP